MNLKTLKFKVIILALGAHETGKMLTADEVQATGFAPLVAVERGFVAAMNPETMEVVPLADLKSEIIAATELPQDDTPDRIAALEEQIQQLANQTPASPPSPNADLKTQNELLKTQNGDVKKENELLKTKLSTLENRLKALENKPAVPPVATPAATVPAVPAAPGAGS